MISGPFSKLHTDRDALAQLVPSLETVSTGLKDMGRFLLQLSNALPDKMEVDPVLSGVFGILQQNLMRLANRDDSLILEEQKAVATMRKGDGVHVKLLLNTMDGFQTAKSEPVVENEFPSYPIKPAEIRSQQLAAFGGRDK